MEPRVEPVWTSHCRYLGGIPDFDLFEDADGDVRYINIHGDPDAWGYFEIRGGRVTAHIIDTGVTDEEQQAMLRYIRLFAPGILKEEPCPTDGQT